MNRKDLAAGAIFAAFGATYAAITWRDLPIGEALNMGPGYFPILLSSLMMAMGATIAVRSLGSAEAISLAAMPWRGPLVLSLATVLFASQLEGLGLFPGILATALIASFAASPFRPVPALLASLGIAILCTLIFGYGIKLPIPIIGSWFRWG
ncbi:tripartite tricarboxylate transporter TctB family protein [Bosea caraganae]|uniref:tripartite tricarboxylate transporter TctB family protein n=1 Tax=Bosea caraganae TaxID=2763117 RepID=UPI0015F0E3F3|nr:tripartite tricarboxylate transporter TctB family protein [Bosea caraganae]